jgi:hypothetical protein
MGGDIGVLNQPKVRRTLSAAPDLDNSRQAPTILSSPPQRLRPFELSDSNTRNVLGFKFNQQNQQLDLAGGCNAINPRDFGVRGSCSIPTAPTKPT